MVFFPGLGLLEFSAHGGGYPRRSVMIWMHVRNVRTDWLPYPVASR
jgi:hypothetical protein